jgi:hypothetical protein
MKRKKVDPGKSDTKTPESDKTPGYPLYPANEDIYIKGKEEPYNETEESPLDLGLDIPGAELDDAQELIGEEDEENNYYSLGDDNDKDFDENNSET